MSISASPRQSLGLSQHSLNLSESTSLGEWLTGWGNLSRLTSLGKWPVGPGAGRAYQAESIKSGRVTHGVEGRGRPATGTPVPRMTRSTDLMVRGSRRVCTSGVHVCVCVPGCASLTNMSPAIRVLHALLQHPQILQTMNLGFSSPTTLSSAQSMLNR